MTPVHDHGHAASCGKIFVRTVWPQRIGLEGKGQGFSMGRKRGDCGYTKRGLLEREGDGLLKKKWSTNLAGLDVRLQCSIEGKRELNESASLRVRTASIETTRTVPSFVAVLSNAFDCCVCLYHQHHHRQQRQHGLRCIVLHAATLPILSLPPMPSVLLLSAM